MANNVQELISALPDDKIGKKNKYCGCKLFIVIEIRRWSVLINFGAKRINFSGIHLGAFKKPE